MLQDSFYSMNTKVFWILTGLIDFPKCAYCHSYVNFIKKNVSLANPYPKCCCMSCSIKFANKFTDTIEKRQHTLDDRYGKDRLAIRMKMSATK